MTKKQPAAKAKRPVFPPLPQLEKPEEFSTPAMEVFCYERDNGSRVVKVSVNGYLNATHSKALADYLQRAAAWVADAPKSKGAR